MKLLIAAGCLLLCITACRNQESNPDYSGWSAYAGSKDGSRYSSNNQLNTGNVSGLQVAWTYSSQDKDTGNHSQNQCNPIMVDGVLYGLTPRVKLFALDAASGQPKWTFDPATLEPDTVSQDPFAFFKVSRGLMYWQNEEGTDKRILYSAGAKLYAVNAANGQVVKSFGNGGYISLDVGLDRDTATYNKFIAATTPGIIYKDLVIMGMRVAESADAAPGHIRAFDVRTGKRAWIFHTIPQPGEKGYDSWEDKDAWQKIWRRQ